MAGIYYHIPFCKRICAYCDFYKSAELKYTNAVLERMHNEMEERKDYLSNEKIETLYFGGGTPSLLTSRQIAALLDHTRESMDCSSVKETTLEANPDDLNPRYLDELRRAGINRLSIGIQSFDDDCLKLMNRRHTALEAQRVVREAQEAGFDNITIDLIFGVPGFQHEHLDDSLAKAIDLGVQHISAYHLTIEPNTAFGRRMARGAFSPVSEEVSEEEYLKVHQTLTHAGFEHYEISNYALPGFRARHNAAYWHGVKYLGIGAGAHSYDGNERHWNVNSVKDYIAGAAPEAEQLTPHDKFNEYVMTRLRTVEGIDLDEISSLFGQEHATLTAKNARRFVEGGLMGQNEHKLFIPPEKLLLSDAIITELFE